MIFKLQTKRLQGRSCHVMFALMALGGSQKPVERHRLQTFWTNCSVFVCFFLFPSQESQSTVVHNPPDGVKVRSGCLKA